MGKNIQKSIGAGLAGILLGVLLSLITDKICEYFGIIPVGNLRTSNNIILFVVLYRTVYNVAGSYLVAKLAPQHPMKHVIVVGIIGTVVSIIGAVATRNMDLGPGWYAWALVVLMLPSSWFGGKLFLRNNPS